MAATISWLATATMPRAAARKLGKPRATVETARRAAARSSRRPPASGVRWSSRPSTRLASVTVGRCPPRP